MVLAETAIRIGTFGLLVGGFGKEGQTRGADDVIGPHRFEGRIQ